MMTRFSGLHKLLIMRIFVYRHTARYWVRLREIAAKGVGLLPREPHETFEGSEAAIRSRHARKSAFWVHVNGHFGAADRRQEDDKHRDP